MRELSCKLIRETVAQLCIEANTILPAETAELIRRAQNEEQSSIGKSVLSDLCKNFELAKKNNLPICQDTGMAVIFADIGQDLHIIDGNFVEALNDGVREGYEKGFLRKSVVKDPLQRINTSDNTPAVIHTRIVPGDKLRLTVAPKGFGSENMSAMKMFLPSSSADEIIDFMVEVVRNAGSNPCPPVILGVGLGGTVDMAAVIAKHALTRPSDKHNSDPFYAELEKTAVERINSLGLGPQGFGGKITALAVNIETYPTHIAGLPCVVNMGCHVTRHAEAVI